MLYPLVILGSKNEMDLSNKVIKNKIIKEKPTAASPETNEQFVLQALDNSNHGLKFSLPPNCKMSLGRALPHIFFNMRLTKIRRLKKTEPKINHTSFDLNLELK